MFSFRVTSILIGIIAAFLGLSSYIGLLDAPVFTIRQRPDHVSFNYMRFKSSFRQIPASFTQLAQCSEYPLSDVLTYGVYFTNPQEVAYDANLYWLGFHGPVKKGCQHELKKFDGVLGEVLEAALPWRHVMSPMIGAMKAYPAMKEKLAKLSWEIRAPIEIYDNGNATIHYIQPRANPIKEY